MSPAAALIARDQRILAGYRAGATIVELCLTEDVSPEIVRRVLRRAGIAPGVIRPTKTNANPDCLAAQYETQSARLGRAGGKIAEDLGCRREAV